jgi:polyhydroxyalkanoate synthase
MQLIPTPDSVSLAAANVFDMVFRGGVADLRRTPAQIVDEAPKRTVYR